MQEVMGNRTLKQQAISLLLVSLVLFGAGCKLTSLCIFSFAAVFITTDAQSISQSNFIHTTPFKQVIVFASVFTLHVWVSKQNHEMKLTPHTYFKTNYDHEDNPKTDENVS